MTVGKDPKATTEMMQAICAANSIGPPDCFLGNDCKKDQQGRQCIGCKKHLMEAIKRVEPMFGALKKCSNPMETRDHPKLDESKVMNKEGHPKHQMLMGTLVWVVTAGRIEATHSTSSLSIHSMSSSRTSGWSSPIIRVSQEGTKPMSGSQFERPSHLQRRQRWPGS
jgi:hypothetical protein